MADIGATGGALIAAGWAGRKLIGPLFDEIAEGWRADYSTRRLKNVNAIGRVAQAKLANRLAETGSVPPRVANRILEEGSWSDEPVMAEYYGGILAAARTPDGRDDRGANWAAIISGLSSFDLYVHYLTYEAVRRLSLGVKINLGDIDVLRQCRLYVPGNELANVLGINDTDESFFRVVVPTVLSLRREGLLGDWYRMGVKEHLDLQASDVRSNLGVVLTPSHAGIELFMTVQCADWVSVHDLLNISAELNTVEGLGHLANARMVGDVGMFVRKEKEKIALFLSDAPSRSLDEE